MLSKCCSLIRINLKRLILVFGMLFVCLSVFAQNTEEPEKRTQKLQWVEDENVFEYKIEIQNEAGEVLISEVTEKNSIEFSFVPGIYKYKLIAYDMLGREAVTTDWISFEILSVAEEAERERLAELKRIEDDRLEKERLAREEAEKKRLEEERRARELEEQRRIEEERLALEKAEKERQEFEEIKKIVEEHPLSKAKDISVKSKDEKKFLKRDDSVNSVYFLEDPNAEAKDNSGEIEEDVNHSKEIDTRDRRTNISAGGGVPIIVYENDYFSKYFGYNITGGGSLRIDSFPLYRPQLCLGFELSGYFSTYKKEVPDFYAFSLNMINAQTDLVFRFKLGKTVIWVQAKAGGGLSFLQTSIASQYRSIYQSTVSDQVFIYPNANAGLSFLLLPGKTLSLEIGGEYCNIFVTNMNTGIVYPYATLGLRF